MMQLWKQVRYRLEHFGCLLLAESIPLLPRRACVALSDFIGNVAFRLDRRSRTVALENLALTFGPEMPVARQLEVARASFRNFARAMLDLFWARNITAANYTRYIRVENPERIHEVRQKYGGVILVALHAGSHEWVSLTGGYIGAPTTMVALDFKNAVLDAVFRRARQHSGNTILGQKQSMLRLMRATKHGGAGLLVDLGLKLEHRGEIIETFGRIMYVTFLHGLLHERTGVPMVPVTNVPHPDGTCSMTVHPPLIFPKGTPLKTIVQQTWNFFEPFIRERPDLWMWNYKHWRYKPRGDPRPYPSYAHVSKKFERVLANHAASVSAE